MKPTEFEEAKWLKSFKCDSAAIANREWFLSKYDIVKRFPFPKYFYFKVLNDRCHIHWAIIQEENNKAIIYFINYRGIVFDKLEYQKVRKAQRELRKNKFAFCTNQKCPYLPLSPVYMRLGQGKKSAPYSKGNLWQSGRQNKKYTDKLQNTYNKNFLNNINPQKQDNNEKSLMERFFPYGFRRLINDTLKVFLIFYIILIIVLLIKSSI